MKLVYQYQSCADCLRDALCSALEKETDATVEVTLGEKINSGMITITADSRDELIHIWDNIERNDIYRRMFIIDLTLSDDILSPTAQ